MLDEKNQLPRFFEDWSEMNRIGIELNDEYDEVDSRGENSLSIPNERPSIPNRGSKRGRCIRHGDHFRAWVEHDDVEDEDAGGPMSIDDSDEALAAVVRHEIILGPAFSDSMFLKYQTSNLSTDSLKSSFFCVGKFAQNSRHTAILVDWFRANDLGIHWALAGRHSEKHPNIFGIYL